MLENKCSKNPIKKRDSISVLLKVLSFLIIAYTLIKLLISVGDILSFSFTYTSFNEVRDYVSFRLSHWIMQGKNPYELSMLNEPTVPFMDLYTSFTPLVVALLCKLTGVNVLVGNYIVNILFVFFTGINIWLVIKDFISTQKLNVFLCMIVNVATFFTMFLTSAPLLNFHADAAGIFFMSLIYLIVYKRRENTFLLAVLTVSLVFTKQILMVMAIPLFLYYLLKDKKAAGRYFFECCIIGIIVLVVMQIFFPLYWTETIYAQFFAVSSESSWFYAIDNIVHCYLRYWPMLVILFGGTIVALVIRRKNGEKIRICNFVCELVEKEEFAVYLILNIVIGTISLLYFSRNFIDGYKYCQDIVAPNLFILTIYVWNKYLDRYVAADEGKTRVRSFMILALCIASLLTYNNFTYEPYTENDDQMYTELQEVIREHQDEVIYLGMNSTQFLVSEDLWEPENIYFNDGHMEFFDRDFTENQLINRFFYNEEITKTADDYVAKVNEMIRDKKFGMVAVCGDLVVDGAVLEQYYYPCGTYPIKNETNGSFDVVVWLPKK